MLDTRVSRDYRLLQLTCDLDQSVIAYDYLSHKHRFASEFSLPYHVSQIVSEFWISKTSRGSSSPDGDFAVKESGPDEA